MRLDDAGALVAHRDRHRTRPVAVADVEVGVADARREDAHPDLAGAWLGHAQVSIVAGSADRRMTAARVVVVMSPGPSAARPAGPRTYGT